MATGDLWAFPSRGRQTTTGASCTKNKTKKRTPRRLCKNFSTKSTCWKKRPFKYVPRPLDQKKRRTKLICVGVARLPSPRVAGAAAPRAHGVGLHDEQVIVPRTTQSPRHRRNGHQRQRSDRPVGRHRPSAKVRHQSRWRPQAFFRLKPRPMKSLWVVSRPSQSTSQTSTHPSSFGLRWPKATRYRK